MHCNRKKSMNEQLSITINNNSINSRLILKGTYHKQENPLNRHSRYSSSQVDNNSNREMANSNSNDNN